VADLGGRGSLRPEVGDFLAWHKLFGEAANQGQITRALKDTHRAQVPTNSIGPTELT
jgi:hypothetical protein